MGQFKSVVSCCLIAGVVSQFAMLLLMSGQTQQETQQSRWRLTSILIRWSRWM